MGNVNYAIFGATGTVGKALASKLAERGQSFRVVGRSEKRLRRDFGRYEPLVEYCAADLSDSANAARAAAAVDTLFYTVGVPYPQFQQHPKLTGVALKAAAAAGVTVQSLSVASTTLDDVFVHYTGRGLRDALQDASPQDSAFMLRRG